MSNNKKLNISIRLLKESVDPEKSLKESQNLKQYARIDKALIFSKSTGSFTPDWAKYLKEDIKVSSASALVFVSVSERWFVLCFGYAHTLLDDSKLVDDFGLRAALNILDKNKIKSSDVFLPSDHSKQKRIQTTQDSSLQGHDMDGYTNILKNITGKSKQEYEQLSKNISATALSIKVVTGKKIEDIPNLCKELFEIYQKQDCEKDFPEVFYIQPVKDENELNNLNEDLLTAIKGENNSLFFEIPELIDFQDISAYQFNFKDRKRKKDSFRAIPSINDFLSLLNKGEEITKQKLDHWNLELPDANENKKQSFSLFKCLVYETNLVQKQYHFSHGKWYCIDSKFNDQLNKELNKTKTDNINSEKILPFHHSNEEKYNEDLAKKLDAHLLDKKCIAMGGYDKIEPCDVLCISNDNENIFIHVKIKHGGSSGLSHLFEQGDISLTLLNNKNQIFINGIKKEVNNFNIKKEKTIHFLIVSKNNSIPLFAEISLFKKIDQMRAKGAKVQWSIVNHQEQEAK